MGGGVLSGSAMQMFGWVAAHALWQGALVAGGLGLVYRYMPGSRTRLRGMAGWLGLAAIVVLSSGTWFAVQRTMAEHHTCWGSTRYAVSHPGTCVAHAVPAARLAFEVDQAAQLASRDAWVDRFQLPVPAPLRFATLEANGAVSVLGGLWGLLVLAGIARLLLALGLLRGVVRRSTPLEGDRLERGMREARRRIGSAPPAEIRESSEVGSPGVAGWRRPVIVLPAGMIEALSPDQLADVIAHELVHVRERHFLVNIVQRAVDCACLLNPFALWISRRIREEREVHCDTVAAGSASAARRRYVESLLCLEHLRGPAGPALVGLLGEGSLLRRIRRLTDRSDGPRSTSRVRGVVVAGTVTAMLALALQISLTMTALTSWTLMTQDIEARHEAQVETSAARSAAAERDSETETQALP